MAVISPVRQLSGVDYISNGYSEVILSNATLNSNGASNIYKATHFRQIDLIGYVSSVGSSSTISFSINSVLVINGSPIATVVKYPSSTLSAAGPVSVSVIDETIGDYIQVSWSVSGSVSGVYCTLVFK